MIQINTNGNTCEGCFHSNVCKYKADAQNVSDKFNHIAKDSMDLSDMADAPISVQIKCKYYSGITTNSDIVFRDDGFIRSTPQIIPCINNDKVLK